MVKARVIYASRHEEPLETDSHFTNHVLMHRVSVVDHRLHIRDNTDSSDIGVE